MLCLDRYLSIRSELIDEINFNGTKDERDSWRCNCVSLEALGSDSDLMFKEIWKKTRNEIERDNHARKE